jgi:hypothetical protein
MTDAGRLSALGLGLLGGVLAAFACLHQGEPVHAGDTDHFEDYALCTGAISADWKSRARFNASANAYKYYTTSVEIDGVWLLDYRTGRLLGSACERKQGQIIGWAEVDLAKEFGIKPKQKVHFAMTTGEIAAGQAALYIIETTTGQMGIYTMVPQPGGNPAVVINRHDISVFRKPKA